MKKFHDKDRLGFALSMIGVYVLLSLIADRASAAAGMRKLVTAPALMLLAALLLGFLIKNGLEEEYGLCRFKGSYKAVLYFIPTLPILSANLWNGAAANFGGAELTLYLAAMLCVGFIEELLFRGFLFGALRRESMKSAILFSSLSFGFGHILNLLGGAELLPTLLQVCYASAIGLLLTLLYIHGGSLLPCAAFHGIFNSLSAFGVTGSNEHRIGTAALLCLLSVGYALWIWKNTGREAGEST